MVVFYRVYFSEIVLIYIFRIVFKNGSRGTSSSLNMRNRLQKSCFKQFESIWFYWLDLSAVQTSETHSGDILLKNGFYHRWTFDNFFIDFPKFFLFFWRFFHGFPFIFELFGIQNPFESLDIWPLFKMLKKIYLFRAFLFWRLHKYAWKKRIIHFIFL